MLKKRNYDVRDLAELTGIPIKTLRWYASSEELRERTGLPAPDEPSPPGSARPNLWYADNPKVSDFIEANRTTIGFYHQIIGTLAQAREELRSARNSADAQAALERLTDLVHQARTLDEALIAGMLWPRRKQERIEATCAQECEAFGIRPARLAD